MRSYYYNLLGPDAVRNIARVGLCLLGIAVAIALLLRH